MAVIKPRTVGSRYARINDEPEIFVSASQNRRYALIMIC